MLRAVTQALLSMTSPIAALFVAPGSINFEFVQMGVLLVLMIFAALIIWYLPQLFKRK